MKKLMKKKVNIFGKTIPVFAIFILGMALVSAALITSWGTITGNVTVSQGLFLDDQVWDAGVIEYSESLTSLEAKTVSSEFHYLKNTANVDATVTLDTKCTNPGTGGCEETTSTTEYLLSSVGGTVPNENRIHIRASDIGITTLSDLDSISWDVNVLSGYIAHVDVIIDKNGDGLRDDALVFEYAKVDPNRCELTPYPIDSFNTFGDSGIVDANAYAWLSSGASGPGCVTEAVAPNGEIFYTNTLSGWKSDYQSITGATKVIGFEIETDNWIMDSESNIKNIKINTVDVVNEITVQAGEQLDFRIVTDFPKMMLPDTYTITTTVNPVI